jgi:hypothetical protein
MHTNCIIRLQGQHYFMLGQDDSLRLLHLRRSHISHYFGGNWATLSFFVTSYGTRKDCKSQVLSL